MNNNISNRFYILRLVFVIFLSSFFTPLWAKQSIDTLPPVTKKWKDYKKEVKEDRSKRMMELKDMMPNLVYDLRYAGTNNFMHRAMYPEKTNVTFMRLPAVASLIEIQHELNEQGFSLKVFDAYRPYAVTVKFWELVKDERYVANPSKGSGHNRGIAIDLTIIDLKTGKELDMGTGFDNFSDSAHWSFTNLPPEVLSNRDLLKVIMEKHGFKAFDTEWWHFYLVNGEKFEILDLDFDKLKKER